MSNIYTGTINTHNEYQNLATLADVTFTQDTTYAIQVQNIVWLREGETGKGFLFNKDKGYTWKSTGDDLYIRTTEAGAIVNIAENSGFFLNKSQGGGATINNQDITITENGTYTADVGYTGIGTATVNVPTGGGGDSGGKYLVRVIDYDGTVLKSDHLNTGDTFTLPTPPSNHSRLIFQEWSSPVTIADNTVTVENSDITIGAVYTTASGLSEFDITLTETTGLTITFNMDGTKDWGDGTSDTETSHTYAATGDYTIKCNGTVMTTSSSNGGIFGQTSSSSKNPVTNVHLGNITNIRSFAFEYCISLPFVTIPNGVTDIEEYAFRASNVLSFITIPSSVTEIRSNTFQNCYSLEGVVIPSGVTRIQSAAFSGCSFLNSITIPSSVTSIVGGLTFSQSGLTSIVIPEGVTEIYNQSFVSCNSLRTVKFLGNVTKIQTRAFNNSRAIIEYDFSKNTEVPTLATVDTLNNINAICKIKVPAALYDDWITAANWATYANYIEAV